MTTETKTLNFPKNWHIWNEFRIPELASALKIYVYNSAIEAGYTCIEVDKIPADDEESANILGYFIHMSRKGDLYREKDLLIKESKYADYDYSHQIDDKILFFPEYWDGWANHTYRISALIGPLKTLIKLHAIKHGWKVVDVETLHENDDLSASAITSIFMQMRTPIEPLIKKNESLDKIFNNKVNILEKEFKTTNGRKNIINIVAKITNNHFKDNPYMAMRCYAKIQAIEIFNKTNNCKKESQTTIYQRYF